MNGAIAKTLSLLLLILVGYFLKSRITTKEQSTGIKEIILGVALPAMIFIALQKIIFEVELMIIPVLALVFNFVMFYLTDLMVILFKIKSGSSLYRTFKMLVPSLAPGLSCFPFLLEYVGEGALANAALADIGNKLFVLVILYLFSMRWYYQHNRLSAGNKRSKVGALLKAMIKEPVNFVIILALFMLGFGINYTSFPSFLQMSIDRLSMIMTPLILVFIGISVKFKWSQIKTILSVLLCRSAVAFFISGLLIVALGITEPSMVLLVVLFPQSSCSFWPFAHMASVSKLEKGSENGTFNMDFAMNVLALSLPFSTILILTLCTFSEPIVSNLYVPFGIGGLFLLAAVLPLYVKYLQKGIVFKAEPSKPE